jgi:hypothetical protein
MGYSSKQAVAWATDQLVPESARVWAALSELHPETGLVPIQLDGVHSDAGHPWDFGGFVEPDWVSWPDEDDPDVIERRAPFSLDFPGLARGSRRRPAAHGPPSKSPLNMW